MSNTVIVLLIFLLVLCIIYMLPTLVASGRGVKNQGSIFIINLFLGWTLLGWVIALSMAMADPSRVEQIK